jgi:hypothetical protein
MEGRTHDGVVLAMNSSGDLRRAADWDSWYVKDLWPTLDVPDGIVSSSLFSLSTGHELPSGVSHLGIFERHGGRARDAVKAIERQLTVPVGDASRPPSSRAHVTSYTKIAEYGDGTGRRVNGVVLIFIDALHPEDDERFNAWYDHHGPHVLDNMDHFACTRYIADDVQPWQPKYISIYETESDDVDRVCREGFEWYMSTIPSLEEYVPDARLWWEQPFERRA